MVKIGMSSRTIVKSSGSFIPSLATVILTEVPFGPFNFFGTSVFEIPIADSPLIAIILSAGNNPSLSEGDPGMGVMTVR